MTKNAVDDGMAESARKAVPLAATSPALLHRLEGLIVERLAP